MRHFVKMNAPARAPLLFMTIPKGVSICDKVPSQQGKTISVGPYHQSCFYLKAPLRSRNNNSKRTRDCNVAQILTIFSRRNRYFLDYMPYLLSVLLLLFCRGIRRNRWAKRKIHKSRICIGTQLYFPKTNSTSWICILVSFMKIAIANGLLKRHDIHYVFLFALKLCFQRRAELRTCSNNLWWLQQKMLRL